MTMLLRSFSRIMLHKRARKRDETLDRNVLGARGRIEAGRAEQRRRVGAERFEALAQHLAALAEGGLGHALEHVGGRRQAAAARGTSRTERRGHLRRRHEGGRRNVEQDFRLAAPRSPAPRAGHRSSSPGAATMRSRHLALEHQHQPVIPRRPGLGGQPGDEQGGRDVVGQVGDDARRPPSRYGRGSNVKRVAGDDGEAAGIVRGDLLQRGDRALDRARSRSRGARPARAARGSVRRARARPRPR